MHVIRYPLPSKDNVCSSSDHQVIEYFDEGSSFFLVMELCTGKAGRIGIQEDATFRRAEKESIILA